MEFNFSEDQELLQQTVRDFLEGECTVEHVRSMWDSETGRSPEFWQQLAEIGISGLLVPDEHGGLGMNEVDMVLVLEETGRAALAEPVIHTAFKRLDPLLLFFYGLLAVGMIRSLRIPRNRAIGAAVSPPWPPRSTNATTMTCASLLGA